MQVFSGTTASLWVDFTHPSGMQIPDEDSVKYSLYSPSSGVIINGESLDVGAEATGVLVEIPAVNNTIGFGKLFDTRTVVVEWMVQGLLYKTIKSYRIVSLPNYSASENDVRKFIGIGSDELPDSDIDIFGSYIRFRGSLEDTTVFDEALSSGTLRELDANEAIVLTEVLQVIPSLRLRVVASMSQGEDRFSRFANTPDFDAIEAAARTRLQEVVAPLLTPVTITSSILILTTPVDPITGG